MTQPKETAHHESVGDGAAESQAPGAAAAPLGRAGPGPSLVKAAGLSSATHS